MLYVIFSDVHSNLEALLAVMRSFPKDAGCVCAGDIVGYGADPEKCVDLVCEKHIDCVIGNHDKAACGDIALAETFTDRAREAVFWTRNMLGDAHRAFLERLPYVLERKDFVMVHGTLQEPETFRYMRSFYDAAETFDVMGTTQKICFVGHSHLPGIFRQSEEGDISYSTQREIKISPKDKYIINVGSVGQPRDMDKRACYCVYDTEKKVVKFFRMEYDIKTAHDKILNAGLPASLAERLLSGT
ncbi:MAG TPA: metallophosphoesterase family protein [Candidatus Omnitrophota bacterium]|nr:metallophosphoesterase family protein [Candidatus Omnitrophota bacterium]